MAYFKYTAKNEHGETLKGKVEAQSRSQAATILRNRSLFLISLQPIQQNSLESITNLFSGVKQDEVVNFTRQLSTMLTAGLTLTDALHILQEQGKPELARVISEILREVEGGSSFAKALESHQKIFSKVYIQLVKAGETAGALDQIMSRLAETLEKQKEFRGKTQGALIYPIIVIVAMIIVGIVMMIFVVPKLTAMYKELGAQLPLPTQILIAMSNFFINDWWILLLMVVGGSFGFKAWHQTPKGRRQFDSFLLKMPIMGVLRKKVLLTEFCQTMGLLLGAGVSLLQALDIVAGAMDNIIYSSAIEQSAREVEKGTPLSLTISRYDDFPQILSQMIAVGEETGKLSDVLLKLAAYFEAESEQAVRNLTAAFEPMIMIVLGLSVGALVMSIILPIYNITTQIQ